MGDLEEIKSIDELRKAQAAAQSQGGSITNYSQWESILQDFETAGIESTGSFHGDMALHQELMNRLQDYIEEIQNEQNQQEIKPQNDESSKIDNRTGQDKEQVVKSNVANATSSVILADYMKYYHLLS